MTPIPAEEEEYEGVEISESVGERESDDAVDILEATELKAESDVGGAGLGQCCVRINTLSLWLFESGRLLRYGGRRCHSTLC